MTLTTLTVVTVAMFFAKSLILREIMFIIIIGLLVDIINTWIQNVGLIRWYYKKKKNEDLGGIQIILKPSAGKQKSANRTDLKKEGDEQQGQRKIQPG